MNKAAGRLDAFVVVGPPAVGKSTAARLLASAAGSGVHVPVDDLRELVVSGRELPGAEFSEALVAQFGAARRVALAALSAYTDLGFTVVLDDALDPLGLREYDDVVGSGAATGVVIRPDKDVATARALQRETRPEGAAYICFGIDIVYAFLDDVLPRLRMSTRLGPTGTV